FCLCFFFITTRPPPRSTLFPYTTLFRSSKKSGPFVPVRTLKRCQSCGLTRSCSACFTVMSLGPSGVMIPTSSVFATASTCQYPRSEEHTSELQSRSDLVCRLLLEKKKKN